MSTGNRSTNWLGIIALALVCGLLGTLGGAFAGGVAGFVVGRQTARTELVHASANVAPQREYNQPQQQVQVTLGENPEQAGKAYLGLTYRLTIDAPSRYPSS